MALKGVTTWGDFVFLIVFVVFGSVAQAQDNITPPAPLEATLTVEYSEVGFTYTVTFHELDQRFDALEITIFSGASQETHTVNILDGEDSFVLITGFQLENGDMEHHATAEYISAAGIRIGSDVETSPSVTISYSLPEAYPADCRLQQVGVAQWTPTDSTFNPAWSNTDERHTLKLVTIIDTQVEPQEEIVQPYYKFFFWPSGNSTSTGICLDTGEWLSLTQLGGIWLDVSLSRHEEFIYIENSDGRVAFFHPNYDELRVFDTEQGYLNGNMIFSHGEATPAP